MRIAAHHIPGTQQHRVSTMLRDTPDYTPTCEWPEDCTVQWGHGIIPAVPFFEAFMPGTLIRGEGEDIAAAERSAFEQYQRDLGCNHQWGRTRPDTRGTVYTNGAGWCRKCGGFRSNMFNPIVELGHLRKPIPQWQDRMMCEDDEHPDPEFDARFEAEYPKEAAGLREQRRIARIRKRLYGVKSDA